MLVQDPNPNRLVRRASHRLGQAVAQIHAELLGGLAVLFHMAFARNLQLASQAADDLAHAALGQRFPGPLLYPSLRVPRLAEFALLKLFEKLISHRSAHGRNSCSRPVALEQTLYAFGHHFVAVGENGLPTNPGNFHDIGHGVFVLGDQAHHQQALARPVRLRKPPSLFDLLHNFFPKFR